jgi:hypothetical protein
MGIARKLKLIEFVYSLLGGEQALSPRIDDAAIALGRDWNVTLEIGFVGGTFHANRADDNHPQENYGPFVGLGVIYPVHHFVLDTCHLAALAVTNIELFLVMQQWPGGPVPGPQAVATATICQSSLGYGNAQKRRSRDSHGGPRPQRGCKAWPL